MAPKAPGGLSMRDDFSTSFIFMITHIFLPCVNLPIMERIALDKQPFRL